MKTFEITIDSDALKNAITSHRAQLQRKMNTEPNKLIKEIINKDIEHLDEAWKSIKEKQVKTEETKNK